MAEIFDDAMIQEVYYKRGEWPDGGPKLVKAPFLRVRMKGEWYVMPRPFGMDMDDLNSTLAASDTGDTSFGREDIGYYCQEALILQENEMGDYINDAENWRGVHEFAWM